MKKNQNQIKNQARIKNFCIIIFGYGRATGEEVCGENGVISGFERGKIFDRPLNKGEKKI